MYGIDPVRAVYGRPMQAMMVKGYKDREFHYWLIEDHEALPGNWEVTGKIEQKLLEIGR